MFAIYLSRVSVFNKTTGNYSCLLTLDSFMTAYDEKIVRNEKLDLTVALWVSTLRKYCHLWNSKKEILLYWNRRKAKFVNRENLKRGEIKIPLKTIVSEH